MLIFIVGHEHRSKMGYWLKVTGKDFIVSLPVTSNP